MSQYKCVEGQSLEDICLQTYGSLDFILKLIQDNGFDNINSQPYSGQLIIWDELLNTDQQVFQNNQSGSITYATKYQDNIPVDTVITGTPGAQIAGSNGAGEPGGVVIPGGMLPYFIGSVSTSTPNESEVTALSQRIVQRSIQEITYTVDVKYFCIAYPTIYGPLSSIKDESGFEIISAFRAETANFTINGSLVNYTIYTLYRATSQTDYNVTFIP